MQAEANHRTIFQRLLKGSIWGVLGTGAGRILNLVSMILAARMLGKEGFGAFGLVQATLGTFALFAGAALGVTATRFIAAEKSANPARAEKIVSLVCISAFGSSLFIAIIIISFAQPLSMSLFDGPGLEQAIMLGSVMVAIGVMRGISDAILAGFERFDFIAIGRFAEGLIALAVIPPLVERFSVMGGVMGLSIGGCAALLLTAICAQNELKAHDMRLKLAGALQEWRILAGFSLPNLLAGTVATPVLWMTMVMLGRSAHGLAAVGIYNAAYQWYSPAVFIPMVLASVSMPVASNVWRKGDIGEFRRQFRNLVVVGFILTSCFSVALAVSADIFVGILGEEYNAARPVLIVLLVAAPLHIISLMGSSALDAMSRAWVKMFIHLVWGFSFITASYVLVAPLGALGLAMSLLISYFFMASIKIVTVMLISRQIAVHGDSI